MPFWFAKKPLPTTDTSRLDSLELKMHALELAWIETLEIVKKAAGRAYAERKREKADKGGAETDDVAPGATNGRKLSADVDRWRVR